MGRENKYKINNHVEWATDISCVKVYDQKTHQIRSISYPEAALWDLVMQKYSLDEITSMMVVITKKNRPDVMEWITNTLDEWLRKELIVKQHG